MRGGPGKWLLVLAVAILALAGGVVAGQHWTQRATGPADTAAPAFQLPDTAANMHALADHAGELVLVNFWATWCPPCRKEIPMLIELQQAYGPQGFQVLGIALDEAAAVGDYARRSGMNYPALLAGPAEGFDLMDAYGAQLGGLPFNALVSPQGQIVYRHEGALTREMLEPLLLEHLPVAG